jgi:flavin reductase (DIM6/NTAB) family NADH-FMN oxidoreductase RutF
MGLPIEVFRRLTAGVYVVSASHAGAADAFTAAWVMQVSFDPLLVALSVNPGNATWPLIHQSGALVINVLQSGQKALARTFGTSSGRDTDKLATVETRITAGGRVLVDAAAWLECRVINEISAGDHMIVIARVVGGDVLHPLAEPMRYAETGDMDGSAALFPSTF